MKQGQTSSAAAAGYGQITGSLAPGAAARRSGTKAGGVAGLAGVGAEVAVVEAGRGGGVASAGAGGLHDGSGRTRILGKGVQLASAVSFGLERGLVAFPSKKARSEAAARTAVPNWCLRFKKMAGWKAVVKKTRALMRKEKA